jgi:glyoxylase-like metal-dependent hydrolase (beta-lactamase superfamily II)
MIGDADNWMRVVGLEIEQFRLGRLAVFGYMVGDEATKTCGLIDPAFETDRILAEVEQRGYRLTHLINTHSHSDHTAGNAAILAATDAKLLIHKYDAPGLEAASNKAFSRAMGGRGSPQPDVLLDDGDIIEIGETSLEVLHTPGHSLGGICLYTEGHVFTGDTLFVGGVGRTDIGGGSMRQLLKSIHERIYTLPDDTIVWPGHDYGMRPNSTVEFEKRTNPFTNAVIVE